jgi:hypothetical protein
MGSDRFGLLWCNLQKVFASEDELFEKWFVIVKGAGISKALPHDDEVGEGAGHCEAAIVDSVVKDDDAGSLHSAA